MIKYINVKQSGKVETIEALESKDFKDEKSFFAKIAERIGSYRMIYKKAEVYLSSRSDKAWTGN